MLVSAGGSSGARGLAYASGIVSPPLSPPPAMQHALRPGFPLPDCGIEGLPAAEGPHRAARGSGRKRPPEGLLLALAAASCRPSPRRPRDRPGRNGGPRRRLRVAARLGGAPLPRRRLPGAHPQPRSPRAASAPGPINWAGGSGRRPRAFSAEQPAPNCGAASCRFQRRHRAAAGAALPFSDIPAFTPGLKVSFAFFRSGR